METARSVVLAEADKGRLADHLRLAEQLGGEAVTIPGQDIARDIIRHAKTNNFTHVVVGTGSLPGNGSASAQHDNAPRQSMEARIRICACHLQMAG